MGVKPTDWRTFWVLLVVANVAAFMLGAFILPAFTGVPSQGIF